MQELEVGKRKLGWRDTGVQMVVIWSEFTFFVIREMILSMLKAYRK